MEAALQIPSDLILWDVVEEHLNEAEFLFERWERALRQPAWTLDDLNHTFEARLFPHLEALAIGGPEVARNTLLPELTAPEEPRRATVAALALLAEADGAWVGTVLRAAAKAEEPLRTAILQALILTESAHVEPRVTRELLADPINALLLDVLTGRDVEPPVHLRRCLEADDARTVTAARAAVLRFGRHDLYAMAALPPAYRTQQHGHDIEHLRAQLKNPASVESALWRLGFCGTLQAGDLCAIYVRRGSLRLAKLAADSLAWIGGLNLADARFHVAEDVVADDEDEALPPFDRDDPAANLELDGVDSLPIPNRAAIWQWWRTQREQIPATGRQVLGSAFSSATALHALRTGALWRRHELAHELSLGSGGRIHIATHAFSARQRRQLAAQAG